MNPLNRTIDSFFSRFERLEDLKNVIGQLQDDLLDKANSEALDGVIKLLDSNYT